MLDVKFRFDVEKTKAVLLLMASLGTAKFDKYKACKLLFFSDKRHLVKYGRPITGDWYVALEHGPVPSGVYDLLKSLIEEDSGPLREAFRVDRNYKYPRLVALGDWNRALLSKSDVRVVEEIVEEFGDKSFAELRAITHETVAYKNVWHPTDADKSFPMNFCDFFEEDEDAVTGAREEMTENFLLRKAFC